MVFLRGAQWIVFMAWVSAAPTCLFAQSMQSDRSDSGPAAEHGDVVLAPAVEPATSGTTSADEGLSDRISHAVRRSTQRLERLIGAAPLLLAAIVVAWLAWRLGGWLSRRKVVTRRLRRNSLLSEMLKHAIRGTFLLAGLLLALEILDATSLAAALLGSAGVIGIALGFAFRDLLENYIASVLLSLRQPFEPDDFVMIDEREGTVVGMNSRATILMTPEGNHLRLPNAHVFKSVIVNYTRNGRRRFDFKVTLLPGCDATRAMQLGLAQVSRVRDVLADPPPFVQVQEASPSGTVLKFFAWVDQAIGDFFGARSDALRRTLEGLKEAHFDLGPPAYRLDTRVATSASLSATTASAGGSAPQSGETPSAIRDAVDKTRDEMAERDLLRSDAKKE